MSPASPASHQVHPHLNLRKLLEPAFVQAYLAIIVHGDQQKDGGFSILLARIRTQNAFQKFPQSLQTACHTQLYMLSSSSRSPPIAGGLHASFLVLRWCAQAWELRKTRLIKCAYMFDFTLPRTACGKASIVLAAYTRRRTTGKACCTPHLVASQQKARNLHR